MTRRKVKKKEDETKGKGRRLKIGGGRGPIGRMGEALIKATEARMKLTDNELKMMLDARIRRNAGYAFRGEFTSYAELGMAVDDETLKKAVNKVYDDIVASIGYDDDVVKATRSVKFGKGYVKSVIRAGLKDGSIVTEMKLVDIVKEEFQTQLDEKVKKIPGGWATVHCTGPKKGQIIAKFKTKSEALAQHKAIEASKLRRKN